jgi:hypothetical protein
MLLSSKLLEQGQAALIVLLVVAVALGFGLSIISQSTTDVRISHQEQEAARAFNVAEAGIEEALQNISSIPFGVPQTIGGFDASINGSYVVDTSNQLESKYQANETAQINLLNHDVALSQVTVNWVDSQNDLENPDCSSELQTPASIQVTVIKGAADNFAKRTYAYNSCNALTNGFSYIATSGDNNYLKKVAVAIEPGDVLMRIRPVYNQTSLLIYGDVDLPPQNYIVSSTAQASSGEQSLATKSIEVTRSEPATPPIFDYVLFSGTNIVK